MDINQFKQSLQNVFLNENSYNTHDIKAWQSGVRSAQLSGNPNFRTGLQAHPLFHAGYQAGMRIGPHAEDPSHMANAVSPERLRSYRDSTKIHDHMVAKVADHFAPILAGQEPDMIPHYKNLISSHLNNHESGQFKSSKDAATAALQIFGNHPNMSRRWDDVITSWEGSTHNPNYRSRNSQGSPFRNESAANHWYAHTFF